MLLVPSTGVLADYMQQGKGGAPRAFRTGRSLPIRSFRLCAMLLVILSAGESHAQVVSPAEPPNKARITRLKDVWPALIECWRPPAGSQGQEVTLRFSLKRTGEVIGRPTITYSRRTGDPITRQAFVAAALGAITQCTPLNLVEGLGDAVASRIISVRFVGSSDVHIRAAQTYQHLKVDRSSALE